MRSFTIFADPYRLHLFRVMCGEAEGQRGGFPCALYGTNSRRPTPLGASPPPILVSTIRFGSNVGPTISGVKWHLNPGLVLSLRGSPPDYFMVGGLWDSLTTPLVSVLAPRQIGIGWFGGNASAVGRVHGPIGVVKKALCARYQYLAVPGSEGEKYANIFLDGGPRRRKY